MTSPSLRQLDIFAQLVASGSMAECADALGVSIDAIRRDMATLERRLGFPLFETAGGAARLTDAGRKTVRAMALLSEQSEAQWRADDPPPTPSVVAQSPPAVAPAAQPGPDSAPASESDRITITITAPAPLFSHFQDALTAFEEANPDIAITLDLHARSAGEAQHMLARGETDIIYFHALGEPAAFPSRYVWSEQIALYLGDAHPLARADMVSAGDLAGVPRLAMEPGNGLRAVTDQALDKARLDLGPPTLETDNLYDIMVAAREGRGWFAAFGPLARDFGRMQGIARLKLAMPLPAIEIRQAVREDADGAAQALAEYLFM